MIGGLWSAQRQSELQRRLDSTLSLLAETCALLRDGEVKAWGNNQFGQLGNGTGGFEKETHEDQNLPKTVGGLTKVTDIAVGYGTDIALLANHEPPLARYDVC